MRVIHRLGALAVAVTVLAGCGGAAKDDDGEPRLGRTLQVADTRQLSLPLDAYQPSPATTRTLNQARIGLFVECMRQFGFRLQPPQPTGTPPATNEGRYGLADEREAQRSGYHPARVGRPPQASGPAMSPAAQAVANGTGQRVAGLPEGGCLAEARRRLAEGGPTPPDPELVDKLKSDSYARSQQDSRMRRAITAWSACMRRAGYDYADPMKANDDPAFQSERPSAAEIAVATADVRCKREVNLVGIWATVESAYQQRFIDRNPEQLQVFKALMEAQVRNAARVLGTGSGA
jgi:hypothetical protein